MFQKNFFGAAVFAILFASPYPVLAAAAPPSTLENLKRLKLDSSTLANLDAELQVPKEWVEKAKSERSIRVLSSLDPGEAKTFFAPFKERYPFIAVDHSSASREARVVKPLVAFKGGRVITDVLISLGGAFPQFKEAKAIDSLSDLPAFKSVVDNAKDPEGLWASITMTYWCFSYNTKLVKKEETPKKWEDLLSPRWRDGKLALGNRPNLWIQHLWKAKGEAWTKDFVQKLFNEAKPQLRKEGLGAMIELLAAGEFHAYVPGSESRTYQKAQEGLPVSFTCPEPVPVSASDEAVLIKGSPSANAGRIFINWILSKEGQIAQFAASYQPSVHKDLIRREFVPFADEILGKPMSFRDPKLELEVLPKVTDFWNALWMRTGPKEK
jgi:iron(III) transport system substrate-binding protein